MKQKILFYISDEDFEKVKNYAKIKTIPIGTICRFVLMEKINSEVPQK